MSVRNPCFAGCVSVSGGETAVEPMSLPVVVETGPWVGREPDLYLSERNVEVDIVDIGRISEICRTCFR